jgi:hypothetical protein
MTDKDALDIITETLNGLEWNADACSQVAEIVQETGRSINDWRKTMACTVRELKQFLSTFDDEAFIGIDGGGMSIVVYDNKTQPAERQAANLGESHDLDYFVIGGLEE